VYNSLNFFPFFVNLNAIIKVTLLSNTPMLFLHSIFLNFGAKIWDVWKNWSINSRPIKLINRPISD
jgi:hypothetical protein